MLASASPSKAGARSARPAPMARAERPPAGGGAGGAPPGGNREVAVRAPVITEGKMDVDAEGGRNHGNPSSAPGSRPPRVDFRRAVLYSLSPLALRPCSPLEDEPGGARPPPGARGGAAPAGGAAPPRDRPGSW